jgi:glyoxylase I family protein
MQVNDLRHVSVVVADTARALAFYRGLLGLAVVARPGPGYPGAWLAVGGRQLHRLEVPNLDPVAGRPRRAVLP